MSHATPAVTPQRAPATTRAYLALLAETEAAWKLFEQKRAALVEALENDPREPDGEGPLSSACWQLDTPSGYSSYGLTEHVRERVARALREARSKLEWAAEEYRDGAL